MSSFSSAVDATLSGCPSDPPTLTSGVYAGTEGFVYRSAFQHLSESDASSHTYWWGRHLVRSFPTPLVRLVGCGGSGRFLPVDTRRS
jgi:hypothetical protein